MLKWEKDVNGYIGFDDDCPLYSVSKDESGWYYEYLPDADGVAGYDTAEEAMAAADFEAAASEIVIDWNDFEPLDLEDLEDAYWDEVAHERMEIAKGLSW